MKKVLLILIILILTPTLSVSQTISTTLDQYPKLTKDSCIVISPQQLRTVNTIFAEHEMFKDMNAQYKAKNLELSIINKEYIKIINLNKQKLSKSEALCKDINLELNKQYKINDKHKRRIKNAKWTVGITAVLSFILGISL